MLKILIFRKINNKLIKNKMKNFKKYLNIEKQRGISGD